MREPLLLAAGKLTGRPSHVQAVAGSSGSSLYVLDSLSNMFFLVDTGAEVSLLPAGSRDRPYHTCRKIRI